MNAPSFSDNRYLPFYIAAAACLVLLLPYAGCHILTSRPHPQNDFLGSENTDGPVSLLDNSTELDQADSDSFGQ